MSAKIGGRRHRQYRLETPTRWCYGCSQYFPECHTKFSNFFVHYDFKDDWTDRSTLKPFQISRSVYPISVTLSARKTSSLKNSLAFVRACRPVSSSFDIWRNQAMCSSSLQGPTCPEDPSGLTFTVKQVSTPRDFRADVLQGSLLGLKFFIYYTSDIPRSPNTLAIYTHSTAIYTSSSNDELICRRLQVEAKH